MGLIQRLDNYLGSLATTGFLRPKVIQYACASCGLLTGAFFLATFIAADFLAPINPLWTAEETADFYASHEKRIHVASALMMFSGAFFLPYITVVSDQMRRIPNVPWILPQLQLASGAGSVFTFMMPAMQLGVIGLRTNRDPAITQMLNESFWLYAIMPFQTFIPLGWAWAIAILYDTRPQPIYPKPMSIFMFLSPLFFLFSAAVHTTRHGAFAWNGAAGFWIPLVVFGLQFIGDWYYLTRAIKNDFFVAKEGSETPLREEEAGGKLSV